MPVTLETVLNEMYDRQATDLFLTTGVPPVMRIKGMLVPHESERLSPEACQKLIYSFLTDEMKEKFEREWEMDLSFGLAGKARLRANVFRQRGSAAAALRMIPEQVPTFEELQLPKIVNDIVNMPKGLVLVCGSTGSGKSTTLAAMIDYLNTNDPLHILTVEDPIEFLHHNKKSIVNQREVGPDTKSFANALQYALREDPDVVLVGEMRSLETIALALTIAETGHLTFGTLHTTDAVQAINRMIDVFPAHQQGQIRSQLATTLQAVICQQLIPTADGMGLALAAEVLMLTAAIRNLILEEKVEQLYGFMQTGSESGMQTMNGALHRLFKERKITRDAAFASSADPGELEK
ncbi:MAG: type IV pilus twitching motility protein PilT, partial [bacterium]